MILINKWWKRFLVSAIVGGMISETVSALTDRKAELNAFIIAMILCLFLSLLYGIIQKK